MPFSSKYRHVYGEVPKQESWFCDVKKPYTSGEGRYAAANATYWATSKAGGGGPMYICRHDAPGRKTEGKDLFTVNVQKGKALDFDFHPFIPNLIASASEDTTLCVTEIPDKIEANVSKFTVQMKGHQKKCHLMKWHPTANNVICSASWDKTIKLWNVENGECVQTYENSPGAALSMDYNNDGSLLAVTEKAKKLMMIFDPRVPDKDVMNFQCMDGSKSSKVFWVPTFNWIGCTGFTKQAKRCVKFWDLKDTSKPIYNETVDQQSSVLMPYYDEDTHMLFLAGKGDGSVMFNELANDKRKVYQLGMYRDTQPQKGGCFVPKRAMRVFDCEIARFMKVTRDAVIPVSFRVPRKAGAEIFQEDIYPDCRAGLPSMTADEYFKGDNKPPVTRSMDPEKAGDSAAGVAFVKKKSYAELSSENEELKARIAELEKQLGELSGE